VQQAVASAWWEAWRQGNGAAAGKLACDAMSRTRVSEFTLKIQLSTLRQQRGAAAKPCTANHPIHLCPPPPPLVYSLHLFLLFCSAHVFSRASARSRGGCAAGAGPCSCMCTINAHRAAHACFKGKSKRLISCVIPNHFRKFASATTGAVLLTCVDHTPHVIALC
jgi:hypothetical protein